MKEETGKRSILVVSGGGGQNIGNAFFNIGGLHILRQMFPGRNVQFIQDQPGYWTFNRKRRNPANYFGLLSKLDIDFIVLQGPVFSETLPKLWDETLERLYRNGTKVIYLSAAFFKYTDEEISVTKKFLKKYPPALISTRDSATYSTLADCCERTYDGICSAWFVPEIYSPAKLANGPYAVLNFDRRPEPNIAVSQGDQPRSGSASEFEFHGDRWELTFPKRQDFLAGKGKAWAYVGAITDFRKLPSEIAGLEIIRTEHRTNPHLGWKIYGNPGGLASDEPFTYFTVYANTSLTLSDRVHACVATLAYGNPAMLFSFSPRSRLFDRMNLSDIRNEPVTLDPAFLEKEKTDQIDSLRAMASELV